MRPHRRTESSRSTCRAPGPDRGPTRVASEKPSAASRSTNVSSNSGHSNVPCASRRSRTSVSTMHAKASRLKSFRGLLRPMELARHKLFIGGRWVEPSTGEYVHDVDPATNQPIAEVAAAGPEDSRAAVEAARAAFEGAEWRDMDSSKRGRLLFQLGQSVRDAFEDLATLESLDVGKPIREAKGDVAFAYKTLEYWAGFADKIQGETIPVPGNRLNYTVRVPVGVTLHIAPWNYPLTLAVRGIAPALAAGNTVVAKPAQLTPLTLLRFAELAEKAGLPPGVLNVVTGPGSTVGKALAGHPDVDSITFTGSLDTGRQIMEMAARHVTPVTLELGGKNPNIVFAEGANLVVGGARAQEGELAAGNFVTPALFDGVAPDMRIAREEIFGPVLTATPFRTRDDLIEIANAVEFGLTAGIWTKDLKTAHAVAARIEAGMVSINEFPITFPQTPFVGWKASGLGHEQGLEATRFYTRVKNVNVNLD